MVSVTEQNLDGHLELTRFMIAKKIFFRFPFELDTTTGKPAILNNEEHCIDILKQCFEIMKDALINGNTGWFFQFGDVTFSKTVRRAYAAGKNYRSYRCYYIY